MVFVTGLQLPTRPGSTLTKICFWKKCLIFRISTPIRNINQEKEIRLKSCYPRKTYAKKMLSNKVDVHNRQEIHRVQLSNCSFGCAQEYNIFGCFLLMLMWFNATVPAILWGNNWGREGRCKIGLSGVHALPLGYFHLRRGCLRVLKFCMGS